MLKLKLSLILSAAYCSIASLIYGVCNQDSVILTGTCNFAPNGQTIKQDLEPITQIGLKSIIGISGDSCDSETIVEYLRTQNKQHEVSFSKEMSAKSLAYLCQRFIYDRLRSDPLKVQVIIGGWNRERNRPVLYWLDSFGSVQEMEHAAHGREFSTVFSFFDRVISTRSLAHDECLNLCRSCWDIVRTRTALNNGNILIKAVNVKGTFSVS